MNITLLALLCAVLISGYLVTLSIPRILLVSLKKRMIDPIDPRKVHKSTASRLGGVSFFPAIFISSVVVMILGNNYFGAFTSYSNIVGMGFASMYILYMIGLYDDIAGVKYRKKFVAQIVAALLVIASGLYLESFYSVTTSFLFPLWIAIPLTVLLITFITNSINLIDGINGLASMLSIIALIVYGTIFLLVGDSINAVICFAAMGALVPFWRHNVFGLRKRTDSRIFMGDCGALVIGFLLAITSVKIWNLDQADNLLITSNLCHVLAYTMLLVPCFDVISVMSHRFVNKQPVFLPDKSHIHHRLMALNLSPRDSLWIIVLIQVLFALVNILLSFFLNMIYIFLINAGMWFLLHKTIKHLNHSLEKKRQ